MLSYTTVKEIGQGGFGVVYEVADANGNHFALKSLNQDAVDRNPQADLEARFRRECRGRGPQAPSPRCNA